MRIDASARTDLGCVRRNNEDAFHIEPELDLYVLSDGMGGQAHGEIASAMAVETVLEHCREANSDHATTLFGNGRADLCERSNRLMSAVRLANRRIFDSAEQNPAQEGMGATIVAAWLDDRRMSLAHVGDSRAYLLRAGSLEQLTADHSLVAEHVRRGTMTPQEAEASLLQNILVRALGTQDHVEVDMDEQILLEGDALLLCSDGLTHMVTDAEIASTLATSKSAQAAAERLIELANRYGGVDNVTVIVLRALPEPAGLVARLRGRPKSSRKPSRKPGGRPDGKPSGKPDSKPGSKPDSKPGGKPDGKKPSPSLRENSRIFVGRGSCGESARADRTISHDINPANSERLHSLRKKAPTPSFRAKRGIPLEL
ncbi:MAG TPA: Stp1/IreP family PP2C-type Ser/Thr phosphatase [Candidatus Acidoferrales bacterium]